MSADNWGICPKCKKLNDEKNKKKVLNAREKYGKIPADEYIRLIAEAKRPIGQESTLREDYEISTDENGQFCINYGCSCSICGFKHDFKHEENLKI